MAKKTSHTALGLAILFFLLTAIFTSLVILHKQNTTIRGFNQALIASGIGFTLVAILVNRWSIIEIKRYLKKAEPVSSHCDYCHSSPACLLPCSHCNSIMWNRISSKYTQVAVFIAHHRWPVLSGFLALLVIAPMSIIYSLKVEKEAEIDRIIERTEAYIERSNELRAKIKQYENNYYELALEEDGYNDISALYTEVSWEFPMLLQEIEALSGEVLSTNIAPDENNQPGLDYAMFVRAIIIDADTVIIDYNRRDTLRIQSSLIKWRWKDYQRAFHPSNASKPARLVKKRKQAAFNLYLELKVQNLVLREFVLHLRNLNIENDVNKQELCRIFGRENGIFDIYQLIRINTSDYEMRGVDSLGFSML